MEKCVFCVFLVVKDIFMLFHRSFLEGLSESQQDSFSKFRDQSHRPSKLSFGISDFEPFGSLARFNSGPKPESNRHHPAVIQTRTLDWLSASKEILQKLFWFACGAWRSRPSIGVSG
jgi:hypothetical protein